MARRINALAAVPLVLLAQACESTEPSAESRYIFTDVTRGPTTSSPMMNTGRIPTSAPLDAEGEHDTVWTYVLAKYDGDGDGQVARAEYDRGATSFDRLDQDGDDALTAADFQSAGGGRRGRGMQREMGPMRARMTLWTYFQDGDDAAELSRDELRSAFAAYDVDGDGLIQSAAFDQLSAGMKTNLGTDSGPGMMARFGAGDPFVSLLQVADADGDEVLAEEELVAFFDAEDDGDGVWRQSAGPGRRRGGGGRGRASERDWSGPKVGELAPDFSLEPPHGGGAVTLSSFRGEKPVALIFGSYT